MRLLKAMLSFNPMFRPNASQLLKCKIFDSLRKPILEKGCPIKIEFDFDDNFEYYENISEQNDREIIDFFKCKIL